MNSHLFLAACLGSMLAMAGPAGAAEKSADAQWAELEKIMRGTPSRPKSKEEAMEMAKGFLTDFDAKAAEFRKDYPADPRRWRLSVQEIQSNKMRGMVGLPPKSDEEIARLTAEVIAAPDADETTKGAASFYRVAAMEDNDAEFKRLAEAHLKEFPDFPGNRQIQAALERKQTEQGQKPKPSDPK